MQTPTVSQTVGIIGGLGSLAGADLFLKVVKSQPVLADQGRYHFLFEQHPFRDLALPLTRTANLSSRKFYAFQVCQTLAARGATSILLPCFASHTFLPELQAELDTPLVNLMTALRQHVGRTLEPGGRLGVLTSDYVRHAGLFEQYFGDAYDLVYPADAGQATLMEAVYGPAGLKAGVLEGPALEELHQVCLDLMAQGPQLLLPGMTELSLVSPALHRRGIRLIDANQVYADYATATATPGPAPAFKLGIVGGIGPAATVDFMAKVVQHTPAGRDQDHLKLVVEQNPQIPDRTAHLLHQEADPTVALYATCKRLECEGAQAIAIPCNTAHAFVARLQPHLTIPIVNMLTETVRVIRERYGTEQPIGLLATAGTVQSRVYHEAAAEAGLSLLVPEPAYQELVMRAIYGAQGVKAGYTQGQCQTDIRAAAAHLRAQGATVLILGCTELPLLLPQSEHFAVAGGEVVLVDPTDLLAQRCVQLALDQSGQGTAKTNPDL